MTSLNLIGKQFRLVGKSTLAFFASNTRHSRRSRWSVSTPLLIGGLLTGSALAFAAFGTMSLSQTLQKESLQASSQTIATISVRLPDLRSQMEAIAKKDDSVLHATSVRESETLLSLISRLGIQDDELLPFVESHPEARALLTPKSGQYATAVLQENGALRLFQLYKDSGEPTVLELTRNAGQLRFTSRPFAYDVQIAMANGRVHGLPSVSLQRSEIPASIISQMHHAFDFDRDMVNQLVPGDTFQVLYEKKYINGNFVCVGRLLAMQFEHQDDSHEFFWFSDGDLNGDYYDASGNRTRRTFMRVPLDVKNVSSEFAALRRHPITGVLRPHNGTDFRAPWGATVRAAADGQVVYAGLGSGYGKYIKLQHGPDCLTLYAHLSSISPNIKVGTEVKHGQIIGKVGQSGLATGPHLHYELIIDGVQINPMTARLPDTKTLSPYKFALMESRIAPLKEKLSLLRRIQGSREATR